MKKIRLPRFEGYKKIKKPDGVITFGTTLYLREDGLALKVLFPAGHVVTFAPLEGELH